MGPFGGHDLFGCLGHGRKIYEQFLSFEEQKKHLAKLHEVYMVDLPTFDHSRLLLVRASRYFAGLQQGPVQTRVIAPLASLAPNRISENQQPLDVFPADSRRQIEKKNTRDRSQ
jgi:hypothetical protein